MVWVDTSVWVRHLREGDPDLEPLLNNGEVMCRPYIVGELACGNLKNSMKSSYFYSFSPRQPRRATRRSSNS